MPAQVWAHQAPGPWSQAQLETLAASCLLLTSVPCDAGGGGGAGGDTRKNRTGPAPTISTVERLVGSKTYLLALLMCQISVLRSNIQHNKIVI